MQLTLVSHYGRKPAELAVVIQRCQELLSRRLASRFRPYRLEQVHGTIIGLEGYRDGDSVLNKNSVAFGAPTRAGPSELLRFLRSEFPSVNVHVGGFRPWVDYRFKSRDQHPYYRSFSVQGDTAVAMGWPARAENLSMDGPVADADFPKTLNEIRWQFHERLGVRHKWHKTPASEDNDFFFVLGKVDGTVAEADLRLAEREVRAFLLGLESLSILIDKKSLTIVAYLDQQLPLETSRAYRLDDDGLTPERLLSLYPER